MQVACLLGSPRANGNSAIIAQVFCAAAASRGANVKTYSLDQLCFSGCRNLFHCKTTLDCCGLSDDLTEVLECVKQADIIVLATPIYFTDITSQMKGCIDRWFSFLVPGYPTAKNKSRLDAGKKLVFIQTQGESEESYQDVLAKYEHSFVMLGIVETFLIRACGVREPGEVNEYPEVLELARATALQIM